MLAGSDPLAYSGLEADLRHLEALGGRGCAVATAWTRQALDRLLSVEPAGAGAVEKAVTAAFRGGGIGAVKTGMLHREAVVCAVARALPAGATLVVDPVLATSGGARLLDDAGLSAMRALLLPRADLVTPNLPELRALVPDADDPADAACRLLGAGARAVLVKGGHGDDPQVVSDVLVTPEGTRVFASPRHAGPAPRGTGCALSVAIAFHLARGLPLEDAVEAARACVTTAIAAAQSRGTRFLVL